MLHTAKLTAKFQTTVPTGVRKALHLQVGDFIGFEVAGSEVRLRRATPIDLAFNQALEGTLGEWSSEQDERAFKNLWWLTVRPRRSWKRLMWWWCPSPSPTVRPASDGRRLSCRSGPSICRPATPCWP